MEQGAEVIYTFSKNDMRTPALLSVKVPFVLALLAVVLSVNNGCKNRKLAYRQVDELKNGIVMVRLRTSELKINKLLEMNKNAKAANLKSEQKQANLRIIRAFRNYFDFCPIYSVYFFYSSSSDQIRARNFKGIFLNDDLEVDHRLIVTTEHVFVLEVGDVDMETFGTHIEGIGVMNTNFELLKKPFPYYVREKKSDIPIFNRGIEGMVKLLNRELKSFHKRSL